MGRAIAAWIAVVIAACSFSPSSYDGTGFLCEDGVCPAGYECVEGRCVRPGGDDSDGAPTGDDAGMGDGDAGPTPAGPCGTMNRLVDDFADGVRDPQWSWSWIDPGVTRSETDGELVFSVPVGANDVSGGYFAGETYDLREAALAAEVAEASTLYTAIEVRDVTDSFAQLVIYMPAGTLTARLGGAIVAEIAYDATAHRFIRLRGQGQQLSWEYSADGEAWSTLTSQTVALRMQYVRALVFAGGSVGDTAVQSRFAGINTAVADAEPWCPASQLADDFDEPTLGFQWDASTSGDCTVLETGGVLQIDAGTGATPACGYRSLSLHSLSGDGVTVSVVSIAGDPGVVGYLAALERDGANGFELSQTGGMLTAVRVAEYTRSDVGSVAFDPTEHRHWRLRVNSGSFEWQVSATGTSWTTVASSLATGDPEALRVSLGARAEAPLGAPSQVRFDDLR